MNNNTPITKSDIEKLYDRELKRGDIVRVKPEWLDDGEDGSMKYVVLEELGGERVKVQALSTSLSMRLAPIFTYDVEWLEYAGRVPKEMYQDA